MISEMTNEDLQKLCLAIGERLEELIKAKGTSASELAPLIGHSGKDGIGKYLKGKNIDNFVKMVLLAEALGTTPNYLVGIPEPEPATAENEASERDIFLGLLEGVFRGFGMVPEQADGLALSALKVLDMPSVRNNHNRRDIARAAGVTVAELYFVGTPKPKLL